MRRRLADGSDRETTAAAEIRGEKRGGRRSAAVPESIFPLSRATHPVCSCDVISGRAHGL